MIKTFEDQLLIYFYLRSRLSDYLDLGLTDPSTDELYYIFENINSTKIDESLEKLKNKGLIKSDNNR